MALLLKSGIKILRLSSAKSQHLRAAAVSKCLLTTNTKNGYLGADNSTNNIQNQDNDFELPPKTWKSFFTSFFRRTPPVPTFEELFEKFMDMAEESKHCSEDSLPRVLDKIRPVLDDILWWLTDGTIVKYMYEFARPAASPSSSPPIVIDNEIKAIVDKLPPPVIHLFQDIMIEVLEHRYNYGSAFDIDVHPNSMVITSDVSHIGKEHLKLFVVDDYLMVTGIAKDAPPVPDCILALTATIHKMINMPSCPYSHDEVTASIVEDPGRGTTQLKVVVPCLDETEVNKPRVYQLNLDTQQFVTKLYNIII